MPRKKVTNFPAPTPEDLESTPDLVLRGPKGALMWKCAHCKKPASSRTTEGKYVCKRHGGTSAAQRDPVKREQLRERKQKQENIQAEKEDRPPVTVPAPKGAGRPLKTGFYSKRDGVNVDELVEKYRSEGLNPDATDEDMLYLRAYIEDMKVLGPVVAQVAIKLEVLLELIDSFLQADVWDGNGLDVAGVLDFMKMLRPLQKEIQSTRAFYGKLMHFTEGMEDRHERLINMSRLRADTALKNAAAKDLSTFTVFLRRFLVLAAETIPPNSLLVLQEKIKKELKEVPRGALEGKVQA